MIIVVAQQDRPGPLSISLLTFFDLDGRCRYRAVSILMALLQRISVRITELLTFLILLTLPTWTGAPSLCEVTRFSLLLDRPFS